MFCARVLIPAKLIKIILRLKPGRLGRRRREVFGLLEPNYGTVCFLLGGRAEMGPLPKRVLFVEGCGLLRCVLGVVEKVECGFLRTNAHGHIGNLFPGTDTVLIKRRASAQRDMQSADPAPVLSKFATNKEMMRATNCLRSTVSLWRIIWGCHGLWAASQV